MNVVCFSDGVGNQMFQYVIYKGFKLNGIDVKADNFRKANNDIELIKFFNIELEYVSKRYQFLMHNRLMKGIKKVYQGIDNISCYNDDYNVYKEDIDYKKYKNTIFDGYFQSELYFKDPILQRELRKDFTLNKKIKLSKEYLDMDDRIKKSNSCSIHYRRNDYLWEVNLPMYGGICTDVYYDNAIDYILKINPDTIFYIFSDDKDYLRKNHRKDNFVLVNEDNKMSDVEEFFLMSHCKNNIIANSTFSWWASWLNDNHDKKILVPNKWFNFRSFEQIYTEDMIRMPIE